MKKTPQVLEVPLYITVFPRLRLIASFTPRQ